MDGVAPASARLSRPPGVGVVEAGSGAACGGAERLRASPAGAVADETGGVALPAQPPRIIGYWREPESPHLPDARDFVDVEADTAGRESIASRLEQGDPAPWVFWGVSRCRLCGCLNGAAELTDAALVWPDGLSHYVREHNVRLPAPVETLILAAPRPRPKITQATWLDLDYDWWVQVSRTDPRAKNMDDRASRLDQADGRPRLRKSVLTRLLEIRRRRAH
jgi:hypothetical protein